MSSFKSKSSLIRADSFKHNISRFHNHRDISYLFLFEGEKPIFRYLASRLGKKKSKERPDKKDENKGSNQRDHEKG